MSIFLEVVPIDTEYLKQYILTYLCFFCCLLSSLGFYLLSRQEKHTVYNETYYKKASQQAHSPIVQH